MHSDCNIYYVLSDNSLSYFNINHTEYFCLKVKIEMLKERVVALKEQEEKLGAMVAALQVAKAREVSMPPPPT